jgi:hypothetical protein
VNITEMKAQLNDAIAEGLKAGRVGDDAAVMAAGERAERLFLRVKDAERNNALMNIGRETFRTGDSPLLKAMEVQSFNVHGQPRVKVDALEALGMKTGAFDGTIGEDTLPQVVPAPPLGADQRFLYLHFPTTAVGADVANVATYRQKDRSLASASDMIRSIASTGQKPETDTTGEVVPLSLSQVANVSTQIPEILFANSGFASWIRNDVELAWKFAVDAMIGDAIAAASPPSSGGGSNIYEDVRFCQEAVRAAGYSPNLIALSPGDALALELLQLSGAVVYAFSQTLPQVVVTPTLGDGEGFVADTAAAGQLYSGPVTFTVLPENAGATNSLTARYESNSGFAVQRADAICLLVGTSS